MNKEQAEEYIKTRLKENDTLVGFFQAQQPFKTWLFFIIGPLAVLSMRNYFVAVTTKGMYFHRLNLLGKFTDNDFFAFDEIESVKIGKGILQRPMKFKFKNGRNIKIKAQLKGVKKLAKLTEITQQYIENNVSISQ